MSLFVVFSCFLTLFAIFAPVCVPALRVPGIGMSPKYSVCRAALLRYSFFMFRPCVFLQLPCVFFSFSFLCFSYVSFFFFVVCSTFFSCLCIFYFHILPCFLHLSFLLHEPAKAQVTRLERLTQKHSTNHFLLSLDGDFATETVLFFIFKDQSSDLRLAIEKHFSVAFQF